MVRAGCRCGRGAGGNEPRRRAPDLGGGERRGVVASMSPSPKTRAETFCARHGLRVPLLLAPMAGACPPELSIAVARGGGMGAMGARRHDKPGKLAKRSKSDAGFPSAPGLRGTEE